MLHRFRKVGFAGLMAALASACGASRGTVRAVPESGNSAAAREKYSQAIEMERRHKWAEAIALYDEALALDPNFTDARFNRGTVRDTLGEVREAEADYVAVSARAPNDPDLWLNLSSTRGRLGRFAEALADVERALRLDSSIEGAADAKWNALVGLGRLDEANALRPSHHLEEVSAGRVHVRWAVPRAQAAVVSKLDFRGVATRLVEYLAPLKPMEDGTIVQVGFTQWRIVQVGDDLLACPVDLWRLPHAIPMPDAFTTLWTNQTQLLVTHAVKADVANTRATDLVMVDPDAMNSGRLVMHRLKERREGFSGWVVGPETRDAAEALLSGDEGHLVSVAVLFRFAPETIRPLLLPPGYRVVVEGVRITSVNDRTGAEVWQHARRDPAGD